MANQPRLPLAPRRGDPRASTPPRGHPARGDAARRLRMNEGISAAIVSIALGASVVCPRRDICSTTAVGVVAPANQSGDYSKVHVSGVVEPEVGLEPTTCSLRVSCSGRLSYPGDVIKVA